MKLNFSKLLHDLVQITGVAQGIGIALPVGVSNAINVADAVTTFGTDNEEMHLATITQHLEAAAIEAPQLAEHIQAIIAKPDTQKVIEAVAPLADHLADVEACPIFPKTK